MEVRHINRSSYATRHPKVYTGANVMSHDIVDCFSNLAGELRD